MKKLDRFILGTPLSDGPAGTVYQAQEILPGEHQRTVALKVLPAIARSDDVALGRFHNEVKVLAQMAVQPHIATIYAMGLTDGYPWLAMEYAPATARQRMGDEPADPAEVLRLLEQVGRGLAVMHALEPPLIHQDLKPANILVDAAGNYKVTDFSLATAVAANRTHGLATVRYAAPEMLSSEFGKVCPATDLYALGHIAYEMALGSRLHRQQFPAVFEGNSGREPPPNKWMMWHASANTRPAAVVEVRADFPPGLSDIIGRLIAKPLPHRYGAARELLSDLEALAKSPPAPGIAAAPGTPASAAPPAAASARSSAGPPASPQPAGATSSAPIPLAGESETAPAAGPTAPQKTAAAPAGNTRYWVRLRGRVTGPFDVAALQRQIRQGQLSRLHQVSSDQVTWKAASQIEELYGPTVV